MSIDSLPDSVCVIPIYPGPTRYPRLIGFILLGIVLFLALIAAGAAAAAGLISMFRPTIFTRVMIVGIVVFVSAAVGGYAIRAHVRLYSRYKREALAKLFPPGTRENSWLQASDIEGDQWSPSKRNQWVTAARSTGIATWVQPRAVEALQSLPRTAEPVEPERIATFDQQHEVWFGVVALGIGTWNLYDKNYAHAILWLGIGCMAIGRLALRGALFTPVVAGQGWVQHGRARWTVENSVAQISGRKGKSLQVVLKGPGGTTRLNYSLKPGRDQEARDFVQRWLHPSPRLQQEAFVD